MSHIATIVGRLHVSASREDVLAYVASRFKRGWLKKQPHSLRLSIARAALRAHRENRKLYAYVTGGVR